MRKLWAAFAVVIVGSFAVLGWVGVEMNHHKPPIPLTVVDENGAPLFPEGAIGDGQKVWRALGGMQVGSVWGHGAYVAPDWTADWLHREITVVLDGWAKAEKAESYAALETERQAALRQRAETMFRTSRYDAATGRLTVSAERAAAFRSNLEHYSDVFTNGRKAYAMPKGAVSDPDKALKLSAFFFWTSWAASTNRPDSNYTYTNNWPHEPLIGNRPTAAALFWTGISIIMLLGGISAMVWYYAGAGGEHAKKDVPARDPLLGLKLTASQKMTIPYFITVAGLILAQLGVGIVTAHYGVEGDGFFGVPLDRWLPYVVTRTWHIQLGLFWIATSWLAAGLFIAPIILGREPKGQALGVGVLLGALVVIVVGSLAGEWMSVFHKFSGTNWFWWGHQGYEYVELGRVWQIGLFAGLLIWLALVGRCVIPAMIEAKPGTSKLLGLFLVSAVAIAGFYGAGLSWGQHTHLTMVEYWRWWVVHLWVEGFFEVFATTALAFIFATLGLVSARMATTASLASASLFMLGGIPGTFHHMYFAGTTTPVMAIGASFSALEVVPLIVLGHEAWENWRLRERAPWMENLKWPLMCFVAVAFWNMLGAGVFGFMINPPISLYYVQGLNTTPVHAHAALFGVYGFLALGFTLLVLRYLRPGMAFNAPLMKTAFWGLNAGLVLMIFTSLLPIGIIQFHASVTQGLWYARSEEFMQQPILQNLRWIRTFGDVVFIVGAIAMAAQVVLGLMGRSAARPLAPRWADSTNMADAKA
ncbi:MAG: nitric-oxide reductase large subunit [Elusimicrobiota bacterium]|nr:nitric-oxide reductase large subunit [Elusimicrobiota bacterium]